MYLRNSLGNKIEIGPGHRIFFHADMGEISFTAQGSQKLYFLSNDDKFYIGKMNYEGFLRIAWLLADLTGLKVKEITTSPDVFGLQFIGSKK